MSTLLGKKITTDSIVFHVDFSNRKCFAPNILNYSSWTVGTGNVNNDTTKYGVTNFNVNGTTGEDSRVLGVDPFNYTSAVVWKSSTVDTTLPSGDGGWNSGNFEIDNSKMYRFTVWTKRDAMTVGPTSSGAFYLGHYARSAEGGLTFSKALVNGVLTNNPYHHITPNPNISVLSSVQSPYLGGINTWTLVVGHVWPVRTEVQTSVPGSAVYGLAANGSHPDSGVWTPAANKIGNPNQGQDYIWYETAVFSNHRAYLYYSADVTATQSFIYPRVDIVDGLEPSIQELLSGPEPIRDLSPKMNIMYPLSTTDFDKNGRGLNFSGLDANVIRGTMSTTFNTQTLSVWFNPNLTVGSQSAGQNILQFGPTSSENSFIVCLGSYTGAIEGEVVSVITNFTAVGGTQNLTAYASNTFTFQAGVWYNLVLSWSETKYLMYINGKEVTTVTAGGGFGNRHAALSTNVTMVHIGSASFTSGGVFYPYNSNFNGKIGSLLVYERNLTASEVRLNFESMMQKYGLI